MQEPEPSLKVLIADDEALTRTILRARLEKLGHEVYEAENGYQAIEMALRIGPDAMVLDIRMPEMDGIEAANVILGKTPCAVLFLSAFSEDTTVAAAAASGAFAFMMKPFRKEDLGPSLRLAVTSFKRIQSQQAEIDGLREQLACLELLDQAAFILMKRQHEAKSEAMVRIHERASVMNVAVAEVAKAIILAEELL